MKICESGGASYERRPPSNHGNDGLTKPSKGTVRRQDRARRCHTRAQSQTRKLRSRRRDSLPGAATGEFRALGFSGENFFFSGDTCARSFARASSASSSAEGCGGSSTGCSICFRPPGNFILNPILPSLKNSLISCSPSVHDAHLCSKIRVRVCLLGHGCYWQTQKRADDRTR